MATKITIAAALAFATMGLGTTSAFAKCGSGFLSKTLCQAGVIDGATSRGLDQAHANLGRPLDHAANQAAGAAADYVVPGSGAAVTQGLEMRDRFNRSGGFNQGDYGQGGYDQGGFNQNGYGQNGNYYGGGYQPASQTYPMQPQVLGNICASPAGTAYVPPHPVGHQCLVQTYNGLFAGVVVR